MSCVLNTISLLLAASVAASPAVQACENGQSSSAQVTQVYPTADVLPENLLRFYIYFSEPMARDGIWDAVVLLDEDGDEVSGAFIENKFDLWSPDDTRLTVLFDPGRVKTGLVAHNTLGRALEPGKSYTLRVLDGAQTRDGCKLAGQFDKHFVAAEADLDSPNLADWQVHPPLSGTREALRVVLDGQTDHVSLAYRIRVTDDTGQRIGGALRLGREEQEWIFTPRQAWQDSPYRIEVNTTLEDIAGNRLTGLFDRPLETAGNSTPGADVEAVDFSPRSN